MSLDLSKFNSNKAKKEENKSDASFGHLDIQSLVDADIDQNLLDNMILNGEESSKINEEVIQKHAKMYGYVFILQQEIDCARKEQEKI